MGISPLRLLFSIMLVPMLAKLAQYNGARLEQFELPNEAAQADVLKEVEGKEAVVTAIEKKKRSRNPAAPFTTSTMQLRGETFGVEDGRHYVEWTMCYPASCTKDELVVLIRLILKRAKDQELFLWCSLY